MNIRLLSSNDQPLPDVLVTVRPPTSAPGNELHWPGIIQARTDVDGVCRIDSTPPDKFQVEVRLANGRVHTSRPITRPLVYASQILTLRIDIS